MNLKILKKDLKRKKSMNLILLIFVMLATTFIAASLNNMKVVTNGVDYFFEQAGVRDFILLTANQKGEEESNKPVDDFLAKEESVKSYSVDDMLLIADSQIETEKGKKLELKNTTVICSFDIQEQKFFDEENQEITEMEAGTIYLPEKLLSENDIDIGDSFYLEIEDGYRKKFKIIGQVKDALFGSDMMGLNRIVISEEDFLEIQNRGNWNVIKSYSICCHDLEEFQKQYNNSDFNVIVGGTKKYMQSVYIMDMVIAGILLMVSLCLILIAVVMLRFTIIFTVNEDYKEIGVMKAIGMKDASIRLLYLMKYFILSVLGAVVGFLVSIPFSQLLLDDVTKGIVSEKAGSDIGLPLLTSIVVVGIVILFAYLSTGKIKKFSPMDAIRDGHSGERFKRKTWIKLGKSKMRATTFMAYNDVLCEVKKYALLLVTTIIGVWLVIMPVNTINTLQSDRMLEWIGMIPSDLFIGETTKLEKLIFNGDRQGFVDYLDEVKEKLEKEGIAFNQVAIEVLLNCKVTNGEYSCKPDASQGIGTTMEQYTYEKGEPPVYENEIAVAQVTAKNLHADIGDTVYVKIGEEEKPFLITAIYQTMRDFGEGIRFHQDAKLDYSTCSGAFNVQVVLKNAETKEELDTILKKVKKIFPQATIENAQEEIDTLTGGVSKMIEPMKKMMLGIVIIINILVVVLMQKMFLIREQGTMGMLKAIGFSNGAIIGWQAKRIVLILLIGIVIGTLTGTPFSTLTSGQVFKYMGAGSITFVINPLEVYVMYPLILFVTTVAACVLTMLKVKQITVKDMGEEE